MEFNVNTDEVVVFTNKLEKLSRSAFPNAVRGTLNGLALDVKQNTIADVTSKTFTERRKNFFKANSRVNFAKGFKLDAMRAEVGFLARNSLKNSKAVDELEQQEHGGNIKDRELIPLEKARTSKNVRKNVKKANRLRTIKKIVKVSGQPGRNQKHKFYNAVFRAGIGGYVQTDKVVFRVKNIRAQKNKGHRFQFQLENLYFVNKSKKVNIQATHFMEKATKESYKKADEIYFKEGDRQFERHFNK